MAINTDLETAFKGVDNMWESNGVSTSTNISLATSLNLAGYVPAFPNQGMPTATTQFYKLNDLTGFIQGTATARETNEMSRTLQSGLSGETSIANTYVVTYAGTYICRSFGATCTIFKNSTSQGTCTRTSTRTLSSLVVTSGSLSNFFLGSGCGTGFTFVTFAT